MKFIKIDKYCIFCTRDGKNANFSLSLVIVILILKNRYLSLFTILKIVSYFIIIVISIIMSVQSIACNICNCTIH